MRFVDEYRDEAAAGRYARALRRIVTRPWTLMEVCGGQTHAIVKFGVDELLPPEVTLVHGPGCPVCVTPLELIEKALAIAARPGVIFCSFGDMLRVPGRSADLLSVKAQGADVRIVYSPLDAVQIARANPDRQVVFFAVGFETTAPANAMAVYQAARSGVGNFSMLVSHVLVPPAMEAILSSKASRVQGFLAAGHVCTVMGYTEYEPLAEKYRVPIVVTGFEPLDILQGVYMCVKQLEEGRAEVENQYVRAVRRDGNVPAQLLVGEVFEVVRRKWRGVGEIPKSGLGLAPRYREFDAEARFGIADEDIPEPAACKSGLIMQGLLKPNECPVFGTACTPERPLGATMVSSEGACAAYYRYRRVGPEKSAEVTHGR
jgi:hydrogenase expression/formation protein HypD